LARHPAEAGKYVEASRQPIGAATDAARAQPMRVVVGEVPDPQDRLTREELLARSKQALEQATERVEAWKARIAQLYTLDTDAQLPRTSFN
jgi:coenzyme F420-reducing hydrogenase alpha subunit